MGGGATGALETPISISQIQASSLGSTVCLFLTDQFEITREIEREGEEKGETRENGPL